MGILQTSGRGWFNLQLVLCGLWLMGLLLLAAAATGADDLSNANDACASETERRKLEALDRPIMNTFFERISPEQKWTGMTDKEDEALLAFWEHTWQAAGWNTRILTLQDAKKHPNYESIQARLNEICMDELSQLYLLRWLAMAAVGGGWMTDYDAFPLRDFGDTSLPHRGEMTVYTAVAATLASGSAESWSHMANFLVDDALQHRSIQRDKLTYWTDSLGLVNAMRSTNVTLHIQKNVLDVGKAMTTETPPDALCDARPFRSKNVLHVSYKGLLTATIRPEWRLPRYRLEVAKECLSVWNHRCNGMIAWSRRR